jgi:hypothetical protein
MEWGDMDLIDLALDRGKRGALVKVVMNEPSGSKICCEVLV